MPIPAVRRLVIAACISVSTLASAGPSLAASDPQGFVDAAAAYRANHGVAPVSAHAAVQRISEERAADMAGKRQLNHDFEHLEQRFKEEGVCWTAFAEIVAYNGSSAVATFIEQWHRSDPHRAILQNGRYDLAGGASQRGSDGRHYAVMVFVQGCGAQKASTGTFSDTASSIFSHDIEWLAGSGITAGCAPGRFCPTSTVTREQMASFLARAKRLPTTSRDWFRDDDGSPHEPDINRVANASIAAGCDSSRYCPTSKVTRGQMASFLARTLALPAATRDWFRDDNGTTHEADINRLAEAGVTGGCADGRFCPSQSVTREQMAAFLRRAFGGS